MVDAVQRRNFVHRIGESSVPPDTSKQDDQHAELVRLLTPIHELANLHLADYRKQHGIEGATEEQQFDADRENDEAAEAEQEGRASGGIVQRNEEGLSSQQEQDGRLGAGEVNATVEPRDPLDNPDDRDPNRLPGEEPSRSYTALANQPNEEADAAEARRSELFDAKPDQGNQASLTGGPSLMQRAAANETEGGAASEKDQHLAETGDMPKPTGVHDEKYAEFQDHAGQEPAPEPKRRGNTVKNEESGGSAGA